MKKLCGLMLFSIGFGMALMIFLPVNLCTVMLVVALLILGYNLFSSCH